MIAFEVMFVMALAIVAVVTIAAVGRPLAEAYAERQKALCRELDSKEAALFKRRIAQLEQQLAELRTQVKQIQETSEFTVKLIESSSGKKITEHKQ